MPAAPLPPVPAPSLLRVALRQTGRDLRSGELRLLILAVVLAVAALSAVAFLADRLDAGLRRDARALLGGDAVLVGDQPPPAAYAADALARGLRLSRSTSFPSMARAPAGAGGASRLVALRAVDAAYPLRGSLRLGDGRELRHGPPRGEAWVDPALLEALGLSLGATVELGDLSLRLGATLALEPDRGLGFLNFAPRVLIHAEDLAATGLVQPGSRVTHRLAVAGPDGRAADAEAWAASARERLAREGARGLQVETLQEGRPEMAQTLVRATRFLKMVALLAALLAAVAVAIVARDLAQRRLDAAALARVLGESQRRIAGAWALEFALVGLLASAAGALLGLGLHAVFLHLLDGLVGVELPPPGLAPLGLAVGVGASLLLGFGLPPLLQIAGVPPLRVLRRELGPPQAGARLGRLAGLLGLGGLLWAAADDLTLGAVAVGGFAAAALVLAAAGAAVVALLRRLLPHLPEASGGPLRAWRLATRQLAARPAHAMLQVAALGLGLFALILLVLLRTDLIASWRAATPPDAPDRFLINIQPEQAAPLRERLEAAGVQGLETAPMIRGRLVEVNGQTVRPGQFATARGNRLAEREFNLSHAAEPPAHNRLVGGRWQGPAAMPDGLPALSVERGLAEELGLRLGDVLAFEVAGQRQAGRIGSLREVDWASMRVNFFVLFEQAEMPGLPSSVMAAYRQPAGGGRLDHELVQAFPNLTLVDLSASLAQVQRVLDQVIAAVEFLFAFTLAAGLLVLGAAVGASREERIREAALMRALGAGRALLGQVQRAELLGLGALAGTLAALGAMVMGAELASRAFGFAWSAPAWVPLAGAAAGALLAVAAGALSLRGVLRRPVAESLRRAEA